MKVGKLVKIIFDLVIIGCVIYTIVWGIYNHITTGVPFNNSVVQWVLWSGWAFSAVHDPVKRTLEVTE